MEHKGTLIEETNAELENSSSVFSCFLDEALLNIMPYRWQAWQAGGEWMKNFFMSLLHSVILDVYL